MANQSMLEKQFVIFEQYCAGTLGVCAYHFESNRAIEYHADELFLMCSTYKLPMAIYLLHKAQQNEIDLNDKYTVTEFDLRTGANSSLNQFNCSVGFPISLRNLLQLMMQESCNTSTDIILRLIGGPKKVTQYLRQNNIENMRVDRYTLEVLAASDGIKNIPSDHRVTLSQYKALENEVSDEHRVNMRTQFLNDVKDCTTPREMTKLLVKLFKNELLNTQYTDLLLSIMRHNKLYPQRLMGLLPYKTPVAHKTGTAQGFTHDIGIITLPHDAGHIAISAFIKDAPQDKAKNEHILAEVARTAYDYFLLNR